MIKGLFQKQLLNIKKSTDTIGVYLLSVFIAFFMPSLGLAQKPPPVEPPQHFSPIELPQEPPIELPQEEFEKINAKAYKNGNPDAESLYLISFYHSRGLVDPKCKPKPPQKSCKPYLEKDLLMASNVYYQGHRVNFEKAMELSKKGDLESTAQAYLILNKLKRHSYQDAIKALEKFKNLHKEIQEHIANQETPTTPPPTPPQEKPSFTEDITYKRTQNIPISALNILDSLINEKSHLSKALQETKRKKAQETFRPFDANDNRIRSAIVSLHDVRLVESTGKIISMVDKPFCSGSYIGDGLILTSLHCVQERLMPREYDDYIDYIDMDSNKLSRVMIPKDNSTQSQQTDFKESIHKIHPRIAVKFPLSNQKSNSITVPVLTKKYSSNVSSISAKQEKYLNFALKILQYDWAILRLGKIPDKDKNKFKEKVKHFEIGSSNRLLDSPNNITTDGISLAGYPGVEYRLNENIINLRRQDDCWVETLLEKIYEKNFKNLGRLRSLFVATICDTYPGHSGSPMYYKSDAGINANYHLLGILVSELDSQIKGDYIFNKFNQETQELDTGKTATLARNFILLIDQSKELLDSINQSISKTNLF